MHDVPLYARPKRPHDKPADFKRGRDIICPNPHCGYKGRPRYKPRGSLLFGLILCCLFLLPGILYFIFRSGYRLLCPECGMQLSSEG